MARSRSNATSARPPFAQALMAALKENSEGGTDSSSMASNSERAISHLPRLDKKKRQAIGNGRMCFFLGGGHRKTKLPNLSVGASHRR